MALQPLTQSWTDLGAGPLAVQAISGSPVAFEIADSQPADSDGNGTLLPPGVVTPFQTSSHIYVRATGAAATVLTSSVSTGGGGGSTDVSALAKESGGNLAAILAKISNDPATGAKQAALQTALGTPLQAGGTVIAGAGENHIGEIGSHTTIGTGTLVRPANTTAYASGQLVANSTTAGSVAATAIPIARKTGGTGRISRVRLSSSNVAAANAIFRVHLFRSSPTSTVGDSGSYSGSQNGVTAVYIGTVSVTLDQLFSDGAKGIGTPSIGSFITFDALAGSQNLYFVLEGRSVYTPASGETYTVALETDVD